MSNATPVIDLSDNLSAFLARQNQFGEKNQLLIQPKKNKSPGDGTASPGFPASSSVSKSVAQWPNMVDDFLLKFFGWTGGTETMGASGVALKFLFGVEVNGAKILAGTGAPEGSVTAGVGSIYMDTAGSSGAILYTKATGTGDTGWEVVGGSSGDNLITAIDTGQTGFTGLVDQWLFEDDLTAENATGRDLNSTMTFERYVTVRGKRFYSLGKNGLLNRGGTHDTVHSLAGTVTVYLLADMNELPTTDTVVFLFGTPGSNAAGTNYQWGILFESTDQHIIATHENGAGNKNITNYTAPPSGIHLWTMTRTADLGGGVQDVSMYLDGVLMTTLQTSNLPTDGAGSQQINIGQSITMLVGEADVCNTLHTPETILQVAQQVGVA